MLVIVSLLAGCIAIPIGDGNKLKISKDGITITDSEGGEHSITVDADEGEVKVEGFGMDEDGELKVGENLDIPETFPKDIPLPKDANIFQASAIPNAVTIFYVTEVSTEEIDKMYEDYFNSGIFTEKPNIVEQKDDGFLYKVFENKRKDGELYLEIRGEAEGTNVNIIFKTED